MKIVNVCNIARDFRRTIIGNSIPGWLTEEDKFLINILLQIQSHFGGSGHILEIGVYKGKLIPIFASNLSANEALFLCDLFDLVEVNSNNKLEIENSYDTITLFEILNILSLFPEVKASVIVENSLHIDPFLAGLQFRFVHVDGSHIYEIVKHDLKIAVKYLDSKIGIIAVDDYRSIHTPGVSRAVWELLDNGEMRVILRSSAKIYLVKKTSILTDENVRTFIHEKNPLMHLSQRDDLEGLIVQSKNDDIYRIPKLKNIFMKLLNLLFFSKSNNEMPHSNVKVIRNT